MPMATARPPRVMEFTLTPNHLKTSSVTAKESGIAVSVMKVVRKFRRKRKRMIATMIAPSRMASLRLPMACSMKSPWRNMISISTPAGSVGRSSASARSMAVLTLSVSKPGALSTLRTTPIVPFTLASPRIGWMP